MATSESTLCLCGCQELCRPGRQWRRGHRAKVHPPNPSRSKADRFWEKVQKTDKCWLWTGSLHRQGYGMIQGSSEGKIVLAHRVSWEIHYGPIPDRLSVLHHCDTPGCTRPDHLFLGTQSDNMNDMVQKGRHAARTHPERVPRGDRSGSRTHPERLPKGTEHWNAQVTEEDVRAIRRLYVPRRVTHEALAQRFGISATQVRRIVTRRRWKHVKD